MDTPLIVIVLGSTLLFFGLLAYKAWWFIRKVQDAPAERDIPQAKNDKEASAAKEAPAEPGPNPPGQ